MKNFSIVLVAVVSMAAFGGCKKKAADGATCETAIAAQAKMDVASAPMATAMIKACKDDKWSADMLSCMVAAKDKAAGEVCAKKMTPAQMAGAMKAAMGGMDMDKMMGDAMKAMGSGAADMQKAADEAMKAAAAAGSAAVAAGSAAEAAGSAAAAMGSAAGEPAPTAVPADGSAPATK